VPPVGGGWRGHRQGVRLEMVGARERDDNDRAVWWRDLDRVVRVRDEKWSRTLRQQQRRRRRRRKRFTQGGIDRLRRIHRESGRLYASSLLRDRDNNMVYCWYAVHRRAHNAIQSDSN